MRAYSHQGHGPRADQNRPDTYQRLPLSTPVDADHGLSIDNELLSAQLARSHQHRGYRRTSHRRSGRTAAPDPRPLEDHPETVMSLSRETLPGRPESCFRASVWGAGFGRRHAPQIGPAGNRQVGFTDRDPPESALSARSLSPTAIDCRDQNDRERDRSQHCEQRPFAAVPVHTQPRLIVLDFSCKHAAQAASALIYPLSG
jgi:hypothetical protein